MRLLFINQCSPTNEGGAETRTREVAVRLARRGHAVTIVCGRTRVDEPQEFDLEGVRVLVRRTLPDALLRRFPYPHYVSLAGANLLLMFHVARLLRKEHFDLVREDVAPFPPTFLLSLARLRAGRRIAVTHMLPARLRDWVAYYGALFGPAGWVMGRLLRAGALKYDRIVCAAGWFATELRRSPAVAGKVSYVPNGVDFAAFSAAEPRARVSGEVRLLSVGRLAETKGQRYAIEALSHLRDMPAVKLDIVGQGPLREALLALAQRLGVAERVRLLPPVAHGEMPGLYRRYDFFVLPSLWEGQPLTLIEAMASRLPVIATDIAGVTDVVDRESATLVARADAADLARCIRSAIADPAAARRRADAAHARARRYDWSETARLELEA